jgi:hypothetical protein
MRSVEDPLPLLQQWDPAQCTQFGDSCKTVDRTVKNKERKLGKNIKYFFLSLSRFYSAPNPSFLISPLPSLGIGPKGNFEEEREKNNGAENK